LNFKIPTKEVEMVDYKYVELEDIGSWPLELIQVAKDNRQLLISYQKERSRIGRLEWRLKINPPENPYAYEYKQLINKLDELLIEYSIVGYHCTRLLPEEIISIKGNGLKLLSKELVISKFNMALSLGYISKEQHTTLITSEVIEESLNDLYGHRTGLVWFCANRSTLQDAVAVHNLFRSWGGEAVYNGHEEGVKAIPILRQIGIPAIVKCAIPINDVLHYHASYAVCFLSYFISDEIENPEPPACFDINAHRDLSANKVLEIIQFDSPLFAELTDYQSWYPHYKIYEEAV